MHCSSISFAIISKLQHEIDSTTLYVATSILQYDLNIIYRTMKRRKRRFFPISIKYLSSQTMKSNKKWRCTERMEISNGCVDLALLCKRAEKHKTSSMITLKHMAFAECERRCWMNGWLVFAETLYALCCENHIMKFLILVCWLQLKFLLLWERFELIEFSNGIIPLQQFWGTCQDSRIKIFNSNWSG